MKRKLWMCSLMLAAAAVAGCHKQAAPAGPAMQAMPVKTAAVTLAPVPVTNEYVATIKSRRSATMQPQVAGRLTDIRVHSGQVVRAGAVLMTIDQRQQSVSVTAAVATERQKKASFDYNKIEIERQRKLFEAGVTSRDAYDQAQQSFANTKADYESAIEARKVQEEQLAYYTIRAPFDGVVGDIPVHIGDYVSSSVTLTTVDENKDLEAYIYVPTEHAGDLHKGLEVELLDSDGKSLEKTRVDFLSEQVDSTLQGILVKAPVHATPQMLRTAQLVKARITWAARPMALVPVLAVTRQAGQNFVFVAKKAGPMTIAEQVPVTLGETVGNNYAVLSGLHPGDPVIVTSTQFLVKGMPVVLLGQ